MGRIHRNIQPAGVGIAFNWPDVAVKRYEGDEVRGTRRVLIGPDEGATGYAIRYFEIEPGAKSSYDRHGHDHGVIVLRGRARLRLGNDTHEVGPGDAIYIEPFEDHQFETIGDEPLGFICVIAQDGHR